MNQSPRKKKDEHRSQDYTDRFWEDQVLRAAGYKLHDRSAHGEAIWKAPDGHLVAHGVALEKELGKKLEK